MSKSPLVITNKFIQTFLVIIFIFYVYELINYYSEPDSYRFGTEVSGWRYNSPIHYLSILLFELFLISLVLGAKFTRLKINSVLLLRGVVLVLVVIQWFF